MRPPTTPGVYVNETSSVHTWIVPQETAIPIFFGFTEKAVIDNGDEENPLIEEINLIKDSTNVRVPVLVNSEREYIKSFGKDDNTGTVFVASESVDGTTAYTSTIKRKSDLAAETYHDYEPGLMYPSVSSFFLNGGDACYIVSIGTFEDFDASNAANIVFDDLKKAIDAAETCTLILPTDLLRYGAAHYYDWCSQFINFCAKSKEQFGVFDVFMQDPTSKVLNDADLTTYRTSVTGDSPRYAAAYYPYLKSLEPAPFATDLSNVQLDDKAMESYDKDITDAVAAYLQENFRTLPPSPFIAGIYGRVDGANGVWTPPANVSPNGVKAPMVNITNAQQENFTHDSIAGKSINAIREFQGSGILVWGNRTNDSNSNDWRYVNIVRLFIAMETDISKGLEAFAFEPNVYNTWAEVKQMIEHYLSGLHGQGAFSGGTADSCYQVQIGLGQTMTEEDVLDGILRVTITVAPIKPAEFIELTFTQHLQV